MEITKEFLERVEEDNCIFLQGKEIYETLINYDTIENFIIIHFDKKIAIKSISDEPVRILFTSKHLKRINNEIVIINDGISPLLIVEHEMSVYLLDNNYDDEHLFIEPHYLELEIENISMIISTELQTNINNIIHRPEDMCDLLNIN